VVNQVLLDWGLIAEKIAWTADASTAMWSVVAVDVWKTTPFMALLILAGPLTVATSTLPLVGKRTRTGSPLRPASVATPE
jgi:ABC-type sugar transport system permease subunit